MFRFLHSADWQLGARFAQFGAKGGDLRAARLKTLRRALELARERSVDAFIVAGDLFEDNLVDDSLVTAVARLLAEFTTVPIFLLPGNHDPYTGPDSVWQRRAWAGLPGHVHVFTQPAAVAVGSAWLLASPLQQKISTLDPSLKLAELAREIPPDAIKVGITHGAPAIEGKHQLNDFPIALNAASRAGLDYLAIGHWHNWLAELDGGRMVMPGTPEPDRFAQERCGFVSSVEIAMAGALPRVEPLPVATLQWQEHRFDLLAAEASQIRLGQTLDLLAPEAARTVLRVVVEGAATPAVSAAAVAWLESRATGFFAAQILDRSLVALSPLELAVLQERHPILAQVLGDLAQLETLATGRTTELAAGERAALSLAEAQDLLRPARIELAALTSADFVQMRQLLLQTFQEVAR